MESSSATLWDGIRNLKKSATDKKIAGVCGGLGEHTPIPAWLWRALFLILFLLWGSGLVVYIVLWLLHAEHTAGRAVNSNQRRIPGWDARLARLPPHSL